MDDAKVGGGNCETSRGRDRLEKGEFFGLWNESWP